MYISPKKVNLKLNQTAVLWGETYESTACRNHSYSNVYLVWIFFTVDLSLLLKISPFLYVLPIIQTNIWINIKAKYLVV